MSKINLGVLVSGTGTNLQAIIHAIDDGWLNANVNVVVSNRSNVLALDRARGSNIPTKVLKYKKNSMTREEYDAALATVLKSSGVEWVVLAGFMRILTPTFLNEFPMRVINIHPSLLPSFPGVDAQQQALNYGVRVTGCTVHFVDEGMDTGPIIAQSVVSIHRNDTRDVLAKRILEREHLLLPTVLNWIADGKINIDDKGKVCVDRHDIDGKDCEIFY